MEERLRSVVRSSDLETSLSSSDKPTKMETNTAASKPLSFKPFSSIPLSSKKPWSFHALNEPCSLDEETLFRFKDRILLPRKNEKACAFAHGEVCFYEGAFFVWP